MDDQGNCKDLLCTCVLHDEHWEYNWMAGFITGISVGVLMMWLFA